jgi:hypothetical protein
LGGLDLRVLRYGMFGQPVYVQFETELLPFTLNTFTTRDLEILESFILHLDAWQRQTITKVELAIVENKMGILAALASWVHESYYRI